MEPFYPPRIISGIQPSQTIHLGHYFGALKQHVDLQHEYPGAAFFLIADYHSLTRNSNRHWLQEATLQLASAYLALGLDINKAYLYRQSDVPATLELYWILSCHSPVRDLLQSPTFKNPESKELQSAGLLTYPLLMAADILCLRATLTPVGHDQSMNIETVRKVARRFNALLQKDLFPIPETRLSVETEVLGTDGRRMNSRYGNIITPFATFKILQEQIASIKTDATSRNAPRNPDKCIVFHLYSLVSSPNAVENMRQRYRDGSIDYLQAKRELTMAIQEYFGRAADKYYEIQKQRDFVLDVLREGFQVAAEQAEITVDAVRQLIGLTV